jgi:hypothetical protein
VVNQVVTAAELPAALWTREWFLTFMKLKNEGGICLFYELNSTLSFLHKRITPLSTHDYTEQFFFFII